MTADLLALLHDLDDHLTSPERLVVLGDAALALACGDAPPPEINVWDDLGPGTRHWQREAFSKEGTYPLPSWQPPTYPLAFEDRLTQLEIAEFRQLRVYHPEPHDMAIMALFANPSSGTEAIERLHRAHALNLARLVASYLEARRTFAGPDVVLRSKFQALVAKLFGDPGVAACEPLLEEERDFSRVGRAELIDRLASTLDQPREVAERLVKPALRLGLRQPRASDLIPGATRSGGWPDLPATFPWPEVDGRPLVHFLQLDLATVPPIEGLPLPVEGLLTFFYDLENLASGNSLADRHGWHVAWIEDCSALLPRQTPADIDPENTWKPMGIDFIETLTLPTRECREIERLGLSRDARNRYLALCDLCSQGGVHQIGGWWRSGQLDPRVTAELGTASEAREERQPLTDELVASVGPHLATWALLLQLESFQDPDGHWIYVGDLDSSCFLIKQGDLAARQFAAAWAVWLY